MFEAVQTENARRLEKYAGARGETSELSSLVRCGICGHNYRRKQAAVRKLWCCSTYNRRGKKYCASNAIPETTLKDACAQVLGLTEYDAKSIENRIAQIEAMPGNILIFHLNDGSMQEVKWAFPSRSESWTDEMRKKAADQVRRHYAKTGTAGWSNAIKTLERTAIGFCCFRVRILLLFRLTPAFANGLFKMQKTEEAASGIAEQDLSSHKRPHSFKIFCTDSHMVREGFS